MRMLPSQTRITAIATVVLLLACGAMAQSSGPMTWSAYFFQGDFFEFGGPNSRVIAQFTPSVAITVTRMEFHAVTGPNDRGQVCVQNPKLLLTNGTIGFTLAFPNSLNGIGGNVSADTGPLKVSFPAGKTVQLLWVSGKGQGQDTCEVGSVNNTVQYTSP